MYNAVLLSDEKSGAIHSVYNEETLNKIKLHFNLFNEVIGYNNLESNKNILKNIEYAFSTWGMPVYDENIIKNYFPNLKCVFYAAGSVKYFADSFLNCNIKIFSAWKANAIPVAEYVVSQIILANKGFFQLSDKNRDKNFLGKYCGNYNAKIGLIGLGSVASEVAKRLNNYKLKLYCYDPYISDEKAKSLNIERTNLVNLFTNCDVISNHLPDIPETYAILNYDLFSKMKSFSTFINTGRGRQVIEEDLCRAMQEDITRTALLDVTFPEPPESTSPLLKTENIIITPHIAGSLGNEIERLSEYMLEEALRYIKGEDCKYEINSNMLKNMA